MLLSICHHLSEVFYNVYMGFNFVVELWGQNFVILFLKYFFFIFLLGPFFVYFTYAIIIIFLLTMTCMTLLHVDV